MLAGRTLDADDEQVAERDYHRNGHAVAFHALRAGKVFVRESGRHSTSVPLRVHGPLRTMAHMNTKAKGSRAERKAIAMLEAAGERCTKAGGSLDILRGGDRGKWTCGCDQVKSGGSTCLP